MEKTSKIYVAGHRGLVGTAILQKLAADGYTNLITRTREALDLFNQQAVAHFFETEKPEFVFLAAGREGGMQANMTCRADFIYENLTIQGNILHSSYLNGVRRLLFLGSARIYPRRCFQPVKEAYLMTGPLEATKAAYSIAKIAGVEMCWSYNRQYATHFIPVLATDIYGPHDSFDLNTAHVLPTLLRKFHLAKLASTGNWEAIARDEACFGPIPPDVEKTFERQDSAPGIVFCGTGTPRREFLYVADLAAACVHLMTLPVDQLSNGNKNMEWLFNIGTGCNWSLSCLADIIGTVVGYPGEFVWDGAKPDGTLCNLLNVSRIKKLGWEARMSLEDGLRQTYDWYLEQTG